MAGGGNALGDGIYLATDLATAKTYAGNTGVYVKCLVSLGRRCVWGALMQARYAAWCQRHGVQQDNSAMTAFLLRQRVQHDPKRKSRGGVITRLSQSHGVETKKPLHPSMSVHRASDGFRVNIWKEETMFQTLLAFRLIMLLLLLPLFVCWRIFDRRNQCPT